MGYKFTLLSFLLFTSLSSFSQKNGAKKTVIKINESKSSVHSSKSKTTTKLNQPPSKEKPKLKVTPSKKTTVTKSISKPSPSIDINNNNKTCLTGIWKGYFAQQSFGFFEDKYRFEVQMEQLANNALNGVTYSYKSTVFYGKATFKGIYTKKTNNILLSETGMVELKIEKKSEPCLMTCYLEYNKIGDLEVISGTYTSQNLKDKKDCGSGKVYLEKSLTTDFYKEDFLVKKEKENVTKPKTPVLKNSANKPTTTPPTNIIKQNIIKPGAEDNLINKTKKSTPKDSVIPEPKKISPPVVKNIPKPEVIQSRDNELVKNITVSEKNFKIDLYDNGEIDGDRISVYHNNELIVSNQMLTDKPISFIIHCDDNDPVHEFVMVAENLGTIPPNTSLMIITAGDKRYELFVTSTEQKNAVVRVEYKHE